MYDLRNGQGVYKYPSGGIYEGNDKKCGQGTLTRENGAKYIGEWLMNKLHGQGTFTSANGSIVSGQFQDGSFVNLIPLNWY